MCRNGVMDDLCMMWHSSAKGVEKRSWFVIYNNSNLIYGRIFSNLGLWVI